MSQILSLFMGNKATDLGLAYQYLDCINWFEEEDSINHLSIFDIDKRPRSIYYGHNIKISKALSSFKKKKEIDDDVDQMTIEYLKHVNASHKQICQYDNNFENDNEIFTYDVRDKDIELLADMISDQLEKIDRCDGLQMIVDCENQYGTIGINALQLFEELQGNKSPKNVFQLFNDNPKSIINKVLAYTKYSESSTMVIPLNLNQMVLKTQDLLQEYAFYINNITSSYRIDITMEEYCQRLLPQPSNNIFNTIIQIPQENDKEEDSILNFKNKLQNNPLNQLNIQEKVLMFEPKFESFGESYFLRGFTPIKETQAYGLDIRIIDDIYLVPKCFGYSDTLALHSCIFSNECYKYTLKNYQNLFEQLSVKEFLHYNLEDIQESKYHLGSMIENYGGIENDEQTE